jgi:hypothetical protein
MSEIIEALLDSISIIADNPASILIVLGFLSILIGWVFGVPLFIVLGIFMLIIGIVVHFMWLER